MTALGQSFQMSVKVVPRLGCGSGQKKGYGHLLSILVGSDLQSGLLEVWPLTQPPNLMTCRACYLLETTASVLVSRGSS